MEAINTPKDFTGRFDLRHKMKLIQLLQTRRVIGAELQPVTFNWKDVGYWHYEVLQPEKLPDYFQAEYDLYGEIRC